MALLFDSSDLLCLLLESFVLVANLVGRSHCGCCHKLLLLLKRVLRVAAHFFELLGGAFDLLLHRLGVHAILLDEHGIGRLVLFDLRSQVHISRWRQHRRLVNFACLHRGVRCLCKDLAAWAVLTLGDGEADQHLGVVRIVIFKVTIELVILWIIEKSHPLCILVILGDRIIQEILFQWDRDRAEELLVLKILDDDADNLLGFCITKRNHDGMG